MVYVDELRVWPTKIRAFKQGSAHLTADTVDELHRFARHLGLKREWFQGRSIVAHYDLTPSKRERAIELGAEFVPAKEQARARVAARNGRSASAKTEKGDA